MNIDNMGIHRPKGHSHVEITVNNEIYKIHRGRQTVVEIKTIAGVPLTDELNQIIDGEVKKLPDDGSVVIKGGEIFISQPPSGAAA